MHTANETAGADADSFPGREVVTFLFRFYRPLTGLYAAVFVASIKKMFV